MNFAEMSNKLREMTKELDGEAAVEEVLDLRSALAKAYALAHRMAPSDESQGDLFQSEQSPAQLELDNDFPCGGV